MLCFFSFYTLYNIFIFLWKSQKNAIVQYRLRAHYLLSIVPNNNYLWYRIVNIYSEQETCEKILLGRFSINLLSLRKTYLNLVLLKLIDSIVDCSGLLSKINVHVRRFPGGKTCDIVSASSSYKVQIFSITCAMHFMLKS